MRRCRGGTRLDPKGRGAVVRSLGVPTKVPVCRPPSGSCRPKRVGLIRIIWAQGHQLTHFQLSPVFAPSHLSLAKSGGGSVGGPEAGPEGKGMAEPTCSAGMELGRAQGHPDIPLLRPVWRRNGEKDKQARSKHHPDTNSGTLCLVEKLTPKHYPWYTNVSAKSMDGRRSHQAAYRGVYIRERVAFRPSVRPSGRWSSCPVSWVCAVHLALPELPRKRVSVKARSADISPAQYCPWQAQ